MKSQALSTGKLGTTGFCFGCGIVKHLAMVLGADLAWERTLAHFKKQLVVA